MHERERLEAIEREVKCIHDDVKRLLRLFALKQIDFLQFGRNFMPTNFEIVAGTSGVFGAILTPPNGAMAAGTVPTWTSSDSTVTLTPSTDGLSCQAAVPAANTAPNFTLSISATSSDPTQGASGVVTNQHTIAIVQPTPPPPAPLTAIDFAQTS